jgi:hypothetical protein
MPATIQKILKPTKYRAEDTSTSLQPTINVINDGGFNTDVAESTTGTFWKTGDDWVVSGGSATCTNDSGDSSSNIVQTNLAHPLENGATYRVTFTLSGFNQTSADDNPDGTGGFRVKLHAEAGTVAIGETRKANGTYVEDLTIASGSGSAANQVIIQTYQDPMSGTIDNISVEKLEFFSNNNYGQIYSGRALEFDGVSDRFATTGGGTHPTPSTEVSGVNSFEDGKPWTMAVWMYLNGTQDCYVIGKDQSTRPHIFLNVQSSIQYIEFRAEDTGNDFYRFGLFPENTWHRLVVTCNGTTISAYSNGALIGTITDGMASTDSSGSFTSTEMWFTGWGVSYESGGNYGTSLDGMMSDAQVWDVEWNQSDITYDYLNPESLALNNGGTSLTESNLKLWYPMQDGHRGQQSYIMDGANTGLGSDEIVTGWNNNDFTSLSSTGTNITSAVSNGSANHELYSNAINMTSGNTFKVTFTLGGTTGSALRFYLSTNSHLGSADYVTDTLSTGTYTFYINSNTTDSTMFFGFRSTYQVCDFSVSNFSAKRVNDKHHATTVFYGDELVTNGDMELDANWANQSSPTTNERSSTQANGGTYSRKVVGDSTGDGCKSDTFSLVAGRTYEVEFYYYLETGSNNLLARLQDGNGSDLGSSEAFGTKDAWTKVTFTRVAENTGSASYFKIYQNGSGSSTFYLDDVSVKEVGVASGWTDADQQLDIPQTALQSYNQLAMPHGKSTSHVAYSDGDSDLKFTTENHSFSFWICPQSDNNAYVFSKGAFQTSGYYVYWGGSTMKLQYQTHQSSAGQTNALDNALTAGKWYHAVVAISDSGTKSQWYINGEEESLNSGHTEATEDTRDFQIYNRGAGSNNPDFGLTELSVFNKTLTQSEAVELYNDGKALDARTHSASNNLLHYWRNNGLGTWTDIGNADSLFNGTPTNIEETLLIPAGVDASRDTQGFLMNRQKDTNSLNLARTDSDLSSMPYITLRRSPLYTGSAVSEFSWSCWAKFNRKPGDMSEDHYIIDNSGATATSGFWVRLSSGNSLKFLVYVDASGTTKSLQDDIDANEGAYVGNDEWKVDKWMHFAGVYKGSDSSGMKLYVNGILVKTADPTTTTMNAAGTDYFAIGHSQANGVPISSGHPDFAIDDVLIYNKFLSDGGVSDGDVAKGEIARIYNAGKRSHR